MTESMPSFKEWVAEQAQPAQPQGLPGVYAAAKAKYTDPKRVKGLIQGLAGTAVEKPHCTITYSRVPVSLDLCQPVLDMFDPKQLESCKVTEVRVFNNPSANKPGQPPVGALVLILEAPIIEAMHQAMRDLGCSYDYNEFHAHVSLMYGVPLDAASDAAKRIQDSIAAEPLTVTLSDPYIEPLKAD